MFLSPTAKLRSAHTFFRYRFFSLVRRTSYRAEPCYSPGGVSGSTLWRDYHSGSIDPPTNFVEQVDNLLTGQDNILSYIQLLISMPMLRAVPAICSIAVSIENEFKSFILISAISRSCLRVIFATFSLFGVDDPFSIPAALRSRSGAGGVFSTNVNEL